jgi:hypothetical protein
VKSEAVTAFEDIQHKKVRGTYKLISHRRRVKGAGRSSETNDANENSEDKKSRQACETKPNHTSRIWNTMAVSPSTRLATNNAFDSSIGQPAQPLQPLPRLENQRDFVRR